MMTMMMMMRQKISWTPAPSSADPIPYSAPLLLFYSSRSFNDDTPGPFYFLRISVFGFLYFRTMYFLPFYHPSPSLRLAASPPYRCVQSIRSRNILLHIRYARSSGRCSSTNGISILAFIFSALDQVRALVGSLQQHQWHFYSRIFFIDQVRALVVVAAAPMAFLFSHPFSLHSIRYARSSVVAAAPMAFLFSHLFSLHWAQKKFGFLALKIF